MEELTWPKRTVKLDNDLGVLTIRLPEEFDTFYKFRYESDNTCGDLQKYRLQNSKYPTLIESGGFKIIEVDSVKNFTISHKFNPCDEGIVLDTGSLTINIESHLTHIMNNDKSRMPVVKMGKMETISKKDFMIIAYENGELYHTMRNPNFQSAKMMAFTRINKYYLLYLNFDCAAQNCDSFIPKMYKALKTVEIKPN